MSKIDAYCLIALIAGITIAIPLCFTLERSGRRSERECNWPILIRMIVSLMERAEVELPPGADRKHFIMSMVEVDTRWVGYEVDMDLISQIIDELYDMAKVVNTDAETEKA